MVLDGQGEEGVEQEAMHGEEEPEKVGEGASKEEDASL